MSIALANAGVMHRRAVYALTLLALAVYMTLASPALTALGIPYSSSNGSIVFKLHPGTYLLWLTLALSLFAEGNPLTALVRRLREMPLLVAYASGIAVACLYSLSRYGMSGMAFYVDTLTMPAVIVLILCRFDQAQLRGVYRLMLSLLLINAVIALGEAAVRRTLIPFSIGDAVVTFNSGSDFRATALLGHPLENALVTSVMLLAALDVPMSAMRRLGMSILFVLSLLAFGGRTSFLLSTIVLLAYATVRCLRGLRTGKYSYFRTVGVLTVVVLASPVATALVWASGLGERVLSKLYLDDSAEVRLRIYDVFDYIDASGLFFGLSPERIQLVSAWIGLDPTFETIENFWLLMLLQLGVFVFIVFCAGLLSGMLLLWRRSGLGGRLALFVFLLTASTTNSLASKSSSLTELFAILYCLAAFAVPAAMSGGTRGTGIRPSFRTATI